MHTETPSNPPRRAGAPAFALAQQRVLRNTYLLLALTMIPTVFGAAVGIKTADLISGHPMLSFLVMFSAVIGLQYAISAKRDSAWGIVFLLIMTFLLGGFLGPLLNVALALKSGAELIGMAAAGTGTVLFVMAGIAASTRRDFTFMGKFLFVGMVVLLLALIANMFLQIPALALTISALVVVVFSLFLLHDLGRIVRGGETNYIIAATGVYVSLFNIFANLLQLLMAFSGESD